MLITVLIFQPYAIKILSLYHLEYIINIHCLGITHLTNIVYVHVHLNLVGPYTMDFIQQHYPRYNYRNLPCVRMLRCSNISWLLHINMSTMYNTHGLCLLPILSHITCDTRTIHTACTVHATLALLLWLLTTHNNNIYHHSHLFHPSQVNKRKQRHLRRRRNRSPPRRSVTSAFRSCARPTSTGRVRSEWRDGGTRTLTASGSPDRWSCIQRKSQCSC